MDSHPDPTLGALEDASRTQIPMDRCHQAQVRFRKVRRTRE